MNVEVTERNAVAQAKAMEVLIDAGWPEAPIWIRCIEPLEETQNTARIRCIFWMRRNPVFKKLVTVEIQLTENGWLAITASLSDPLLVIPQVTSVWDFDEQGNNPRKR